MYSPRLSAWAQLCPFRAAPLPALCLLHATASPARNALASHWGSLSPGITFKSGRQREEAKGTLCLIGFHSAPLINKKRPPYGEVLHPLKEMLLLMEPQCSAWEGLGLGGQHHGFASQTVICNWMQWEGSERRALLRTLLLTEALIQSLMYQLSLVCFNNRGKGIPPQPVNCIEKKQITLSIYTSNTASLVCDTHWRMQNYPLMLLLWQMILRWKKANYVRFPCVLNRFRALVSLAAIDNDCLVTVPESEHNTKLQGMFWELWLIMFKSITEINSFASNNNEFPHFWCSLFGYQ